MDFKSLSKKSCSNNLKEKIRENSKKCETFLAMELI